MGGKTDPEDKCVLDTLTCEVSEETNYLEIIAIRYVKKYY